MSVCTMSGSPWVCFWSFRGCRSCHVNVQFSFFSPPPVKLDSSQFACDSKIVMDFSETAFHVIFFTVFDSKLFYGRWVVVSDTQKRFVSLLGWGAHFNTCSCVEKRQEVQEHRLFLMRLNVVAGSSNQPWDFNPFFFSFFSINLFFCCPTNRNNQTQVLLLFWSQTMSRKGSKGQKHDW